MELEEIIKKRRSVRKFKNQTIDGSIVNKLIEAAIHAPSACNIQGWKFIVIDNQLIKDKIVDYGGSILIKNAPLGILVLYDNRTKNTAYRDDIQSASAAIENLLLTASSLNLGSCWICHLPSKKQLKKILNIPGYFSPIACVLLGYFENEPMAIPRKYNLEQVMSYNEFSNNWPKEKISCPKLIIEKMLLKIYYLTPRLIKKHLLNKILDKHFVKKFEN